MRVQHFLGILLGVFILSSCSSDSNTKRYNLTTTATPTEGGTVTPSSGEYEDGEQVEISASSNENWVFDGWQGDLLGDENPQTITMDSDKSVAALFVKQDYSLTITTEGQGTVTEEIVQQKSTDYPHGTVVELTAEPDEGWEFEGWQGDIESTENPTTITIEDETEITAVFSGIEYPLEVTIEGEGTVGEEVVQSKTDYSEGTVVELTADAAENWIFSEWSGDLEGNENPAQITVDGPKEVTATFLRTFNLTTNTDPGEGGTITPEAGQYERDATFDVEAVPSEGWKFIEWEGDFSGTVNPFSLTMNGDKTITANFERKEFELSIETEGNGNIDIELISGTDTGSGFLFESEVRLIANANENWKFVNWSGDIDSDDNPVELVITENTQVKAHFVETFYLNENGITVHCPLASPGDTGVIDGVQYEAVDRELLLDRRDEGADLTKVCTSLVEDMSQLFRDFYFNQPIGNWDVSNVTDMSRMFMKSDMESYSELEFNQDISEWDVSNVRNMSQMFRGLILNENIFNQPIGNWDVSNVRNMSGMFAHSLFNGDISDWDVSNVTDMSEMFARSIFNSPIGDWDVSKVTNMSYMFGEKGAGPATQFNQPIGDWDVSNVIDMSGMFYGSLFNQPIGDWDVSNVENMSSMFGGVSYNASTSQFNQPIDNWDVSSVTNMSEMFKESSFNQPIGDWDVSNVIDMSGLFSGAKFNQPIGNWDVSNVKYMNNMFGGVSFYGAFSDFNQPIGNWDVSNVEDMNHMFYGSPFNQPIGNWDVSHVINMNGMFSGSTDRDGYILNKSTFDQAIGNWDVSRVTSMAGMFQASSFDQAIGNWDVVNVTNMSRMFSGFELAGDRGFVESVFNQTIGDWDVSNVRNMDAMFEMAILFNQDLSEWCVSNLPEKPTDFDTQTPEWVLPKPLWGTCPDQ